MFITIFAGARPNFMKIAPIIKALKSARKAGTSQHNLAPHLEKIAAGRWEKGSIPNLWDGKTSDRMVRILLDIYQS